jgi:thymidylate synthase
MSEGFPVLTTKKIAWKTMVTELIWFLRGDTNIKFLVDNGCHIWDGDAYKNYCEQQSRQLIKGCTYQEFIDKIKTDAEFAQKWGELGPVYGKQWRSWGGKKKKYQQQRSYGGSFGGPTHVEYGELVEYDVPGMDQIQNLINDLKTNPDSRRLMVNAWNPADLPHQVLPPCHYGFQVYTRELSLDERLDLMRKRTKDGTVDYDNRHHGFLDFHNIPKRAISLMWNQRSCDFPLGIPMNISSYALLLTIIAKEVNMVPDELIGNLGDCHIYLNQIEGVKEQIGREPYPLPKLLCLDEYHYLMDKELVGEIPFTEKIEKFRPDFFTLENYQSHPKIYFPLSN